LPHRIPELQNRIERWDKYTTLDEALRLVHPPAGFPPPCYRCQWLAARGLINGRWKSRLASSFFPEADWIYHSRAHKYRKHNGSWHD
jgi:hypothetical protein